ncbi:hypothetical protein [Marivirga sp.]|uniref:hypothetical protein n=1 Tax=Marivirga sp. TaxID=2018662 RepID=UPI002D802539|nr:hypothetical protein [Marivirga sp.]HET8860416.1 hypothetical protein [Marivirga sp.]
MKLLQNSDLAKIKFNEEKLKLQEAILEGKYSFDSLINHLTIPKIQDKAAWVMSGVVEHRPKILTENEIGYLLKLLEDGISGVAERNIWRTFQFIDIPRVHEERCLHLAFETLENKKSAIAVEVFAMTTAFELSKNNEDLKHLLKEILLFKMGNSSKGFQSRAGKILKRIS